MIEPVKPFYVEVVPYQDEELCVRHSDYARLEQECERLRALLRSAQWCMQTTPSCQSGIVDICGCRKCVHRRIDAALSAKP